MTSHDQTNPKTDQTRKLREHLHSGRPLTTKVLGHHLDVDRNTAARIAKAQGLESEGTTYPWRRIWRQLHDIESSGLATHLDALMARHPKSKILGGIEDLEADLRTPLVKFPGMAALLKEHPDTLRKQIKKGTRSLPFPVLDLGPRMQLYRPLDVILWRAEEILLDLPVAVQRAPKPAADTSAGEMVETCPETPAESRKKVIFGAAARSKRQRAG
jgi:hypothetical protein